jgi:hypothetical protein
MFRCKKLRRKEPESPPPPVDTKPRLIITDRHERIATITTDFAVTSLRRNRGDIDTSITVRDTDFYAYGDAAHGSSQSATVPTDLLRQAIDALTPEDF